MNLDFDFFTNGEQTKVIIEDRGNRINRYAVYKGFCCVADLLNRKRALAIAKQTYKDQLND